MTYTIAVSRAALKKGVPYAYTEEAISDSNVQAKPDLHGKRGDRECTVVS